MRAKLPGLPAVVICLALGACLPGLENEASLPSVSEAGQRDAPDGDTDTGTDSRAAEAAEALMGEPETSETAEAEAEEEAGAQPDPAPERPVDMRDMLPEPTPLPAILRDRQAACERGGGQLLPRGRTGLFDCLRQTRDAGRRCGRATDCEGACLARSQSCAPFTPLFGCHDVLDRGGSRVTVCME